MNDIDLAWAAGFFDGEGCVTAPVRIRPPNKRDYSLALYVGQVDPRPLQRLRSYFGGEVVPRTSWGKGRPIYMWRVTGMTAEATLRLLLPFLMVKAEQARLALELRDRIHAYRRIGKAVEPVETEARLAIVAAIREDKWRHHTLQPEVVVQSLDGPARQTISARNTDERAISSASR